MAHTVFFVDDSSSAFEPWTAELSFLGIPVQTLSTADVAFERLWSASASEVGLVVIDVMLAVEDLGHPSFSPERTAGYQETGLRLLEDLIVQNDSIFPTRAVLLSNTTQYETMRNVRSASSKYQIPFWEKASITSPLTFADLVIARMSELAT